MPGSGGHHNPSKSNPFHRPHQHLQKLWTYLTDSAMSKTNEVALFIHAYSVVSMTMHYIKKANLILESEHYFKFRVENKNKICHCPFMMPAVTKETQISSLHFGITNHKDNIILGILWLVAPNNSTRIMFWSSACASMVGTTGDMLLVQCELNALSHLFCDCTFLPWYQRGPLR